MGRWNLGEFVCNIVWYFANRKSKKKWESLRKRWEVGVRSMGSGKFRLLCSLTPPPPLPPHVLQSLLHPPLCTTVSLWCQTYHIQLKLENDNFQKDFSCLMNWIVFSCKEGIWSTHLQNPKTYQNLSQSHSSRINMDREIAALEWAAMATESQGKNWQQNTLLIFTTKRK